MSQSPTCQACAQQRGRSVAMIPEQGKFQDPQGFRCTAWLCPDCSNRIGTRDVIVRPPCRKCGYSEEVPVKEGPSGYLPGTGAPTDGKAFMDMMKGQSIPGRP